MRQNIKLNKAFGLVEALIALIIIAITMVSALETVSSALRQVKSNETEDKANQLMSGVLEYAYGYRNIDLPTEVNVNIFDNDPNQMVCYKPTFDLASNKVNLSLVGNNPTNCALMNAVDDNYLVDYSGNDSGEVGEEIYHQIIFTNIPITGTGNLEDKIRITSIVLYSQEGNIVRQRVDAYRPIFF
jgi:type II secretory pathway pseudopilin PulG